MKKNYFSFVRFFAILFCFFNFSYSFGQISYNENFDVSGNTPTGWAAIGAAADWGVSTNLGNNIVGLAHSVPNFFRCRYPNNGTGVSTESYATPPFSLEGIGTNTSTVGFWMYRDSLLPTNYDSLSVLINTSLSLNGATSLGSVARCRSIAIPETQAVNGWYYYSFNIPNSFNTAVNYIIFKSTNYGASPSINARRICIDDVSWTEYPPLCTGTPIAGTISSPDTLICGGSGTSTLTLNNASTGTGISYSWFSSASQTGPWVAFGTDSTSAVANLTTTQYVNCVVTCASSLLTAASDTFAIIVSPNPIPVVSILAANDTICRNDTLTMIGNGAVSYLWSSTNNANLSVNDSIDVAPTNSTTYTLVGTDAIGCISAPVSQTIVVGRRPTIFNFTNSNPTICENGTSTLAVQATSGVGGGGVVLTYEWIPTGQTTASVSVSPLATTLYTVNVIGQYGCFSTDTTTVFVDTTLVSPIVSLNPDSLNICQGTTGTYSLAAICDVATATYAWAGSTGGAINSTNDTLTVNTPNQTITYTVTVTDPANGCKSSATSSLYVRPTPTINISSPTTTICLNGTAVINLNIGNTGGALTSTYTTTWNPSGLTGTSISVAPVTSTFFVATVTSAYGCQRIDSLLINVDPTLVSPTIAVTPSLIDLCANNLTSVQLIASTDAVQPSFAWTPNNVGSTNDTVVVNPTNTTSYSVTVTDQFGCSSSALSAVNVNASPMADFTSVLGTSNTVDFTSASVGGATFSWTFGDGSTSTIENPTHAYTTAGTYDVTLVVTSAAGCSDTIIKSIVVTNSSSLSENDQFNNFNVFPNPSKGLFNIQMNSNALSSKIAVMNLLGEVILTKELVQTSNGNFESQIDLSNYPNGIYLIDLSTENQTVVRKISKQ
jgi:PKD repeat protein